MLGIISMLAQMMPEEDMIDKAIEALNDYKLGIGRKNDEGKLVQPVPELMMLIVRWKNEGKDMATIMAESEQLEQEHKIAQAMFKGGN